MSDQNPQHDSEAAMESNELTVPEKVAIEGDLPLTAIDIESQKDMESGRYHPLRSLDKWFAARPTPAARLAVLGSVLPDTVTDDELLNLMQIGPKEKSDDIAEFVIKKFAEKDDKKSPNENLDEYYGYPNPNTQSPTEAELRDLNKKIEDKWNGSPTIIDPTAGRGIIPFEALRYNLSAIANDLNPIPTLISKVALEYAPEVGSITPEINQWKNEIVSRTNERIKDYYPTKESSRQILNSAVTYIITCDSCGGEIPLVGKWWVNKTSNGGDAIRPQYNSGEVAYEHIRAEEHDDFDPSEAPVSRGGGAECPHCSVPIDADTIRGKFRDDEFEYSIYAVNYETNDGEWEWRAGDNLDQEAIDDAAERVENDFAMLDFLSESIEVSSRLNDPTNYGMQEWRDIFTPRQLIAHYELFQVFDQVKQEILNSYERDKAELMLIILAMGIKRQIEFNNRLASWHEQRGYGSSIFSNNNYSLKRMFVDNNICAARRGLEQRTDTVLDSYEKVASYVSGVEETGEVHNMDAANLTDVFEEDSLQVAVVDPPYFDSIMYGELSDLLYLPFRQLLGDEFQDLFNTKLVRKDDQAVANAARHEDPEQFYEEKMQDIFSEIKDILIEDGVLTLMFTDREIRAWNTISKALIESGFTITASHPIKTEMSDRIAAQEASAVNSSILLIARNRTEGSGEPVLWEDVVDTVEQTAQKEARRLLSIESVDKVDTSIAAFGPALEKYSESYPVEDKQGNMVEPEKVLAKAREEVSNIIANDELSTETTRVDGLTRWYILCNVIYGESTILFDEANQLGLATGIDIAELKTSTKIWSKSSGDVSLNDHTDRVQDIIKLRDDRSDNPSSRKYPVDPTTTTFTYAIDAVHAALHVYEREGPQFTRDWLAERGFKNDTEFTTAVKALLEAVPSDTEMHDTLTDLIAGETGDYLDISVSNLNISNDNDTQTGLEEFK